MAFIFDTLGQIQRTTAMTDPIEVVLQFERVINMPAMPRASVP